MQFASAVERAVRDGLRLHNDIGYLDVRQFAELSSKLRGDGDAALRKLFDAKIDELSNAARLED